MATRDRGIRFNSRKPAGADNEVQLIVSAIAETACQTDSAAIAVVIEDLKASGFEPSELLADTAYGGDENHSAVSPRGLISSRRPQGNARPARSIRNNSRWRTSR